MEKEPYHGGNIAEVENGHLERVIAELLPTLNKEEKILHKKS